MVVPLKAKIFLPQNDSNGCLVVAPKLTHGKNVKRIATDWLECHCFRAKASRVFPHNGPASDVSRAGVGCPLGEVSRRLEMAVTDESSLSAPVASNLKDKKIL